MGGLNKKVNKWFIATKKLGEDIFDMSGLTIHEPPVGTYQADPFIVEHKGVHYVFHEWYDYTKGRIAVSTLKDRLLTPPKIIIEREWHMSFPAIYQKDGEYYMTPEEGQSGKLRIYRATNFPYEWEEYQVVAEGVFADPIMWGKTIYTTEGDHSLRKFYGEDGVWNKVLSDDIMNSRNAGNMFVHNGKLVRPVQECEKQYGRAILFPELDKRIEPDWYPGLTGTHTFNFNNQYVVVDGRLKL